MIAAEFDYQAPAELNAALALLAEHGDSAMVLAGGMSIVPMMNLGLVTPEVVISLNHIEGLDYVRVDGDNVAVGAMTRHHAIVSDLIVVNELALLGESVALIGDVQVRNRGTIGGSLAHCDPAANYPPVLVAYQAKIRLESHRGSREVPASNFFQGLMQTALDSDELITEIRFPKQPAGSGTSFQKFARVSGNFPIVSAAALIEAGRSAGRVALGGVGPIPVMVELKPYLDHGLTDSALDDIVGAIAVAMGEPFSDINASAEYRREMACVFARRSIERAWARARE